MGQGIFLWASYPCGAGRRHALCHELLPVRLVLRLRLLRLLAQNLPGVGFKV